MPRPPTADSIRAAVELARGDVKALELELLAARETLRLLEAASKGLTIAAKRSMVGRNVEASILAGKPENVRTSANRARHKNAAREAMLAGNHVAADLAKACKVARSTANAWLVGSNAITEPHITTLARAPFNIPRESWPKVA